MKTPQKRKTFLQNYFEEMPTALLFCQMVAVVAALVLMIYGEFFGSEAEVLAVSFFFANGMGLWIKFFGALAGTLFPRLIVRKGAGALLWLPAIIIGSYCGTETAIRLSGWLFGSHFPDQPFRGDYLLMVAANASMALIFSGIAFLYILAKRRLRQKSIEAERLQRLQTQTQLVALQSKTRPHFLFNTLNAMLSLIRKDPEKVETMILNISDIYRKMLQYPEERLIPVKEEIQLVKEYLEIEKIRMGERLSYALAVDENAEGCQIPPLIIEPVVENSVIHGIGAKPEGGEVRIEVRKAKQKVEISVKDNGVGIDKASKTSGFGLYSVKERLQLKYGGRGRFQIFERSGGGVEIVMEIPCED